MFEDINKQNQRDIEFYRSEIERIKNLPTEDEKDQIENMGNIMDASLEAIKRLYKADLIKDDKLYYIDTNDAVWGDYEALKEHYAESSNISDDYMADAEVESEEVTGKELKERIDQGESFDLGGLK